MEEFGVLSAHAKPRGEGSRLHNNITLGEVYNTNDPKQMGRLQIFCPALDHSKSPALPWAFYGSPFGGVVEDMPRGRSGEVTNGPVAYGMWAIPPVGSRVLVMCIDGNPQMRVWLGSIPAEMLSHTLPHGRYLDENESGPVSSNESPIQPLHTNQMDMFTNDFAPQQRFESEEYNTRGADRPVGRTQPNQVGTLNKYSSKSDDQGGYGDTTVPGSEGSTSNIFSWTTPGFHSMSMDDNPDSNRIRFRTTSGNQIILDDSNERIYISTPLGMTWFEMDEKGTIDVYAEHDISLRSKADVNITSDQTIRLAGKEGVHITSEKEVRIHSGGDTNIKADGNMRMKVDESIFVETTNDFHAKANNVRIHGSTLYFEGDNKIHLKSSAVEVGNSLNVDGPVGIVGKLDVIGRVASSVDVVTTTHSLNLHTHTYIKPKYPAVPDPIAPTMPQLAPTGSAATASAAPESAEESESEVVMSFFPSRVPQHEPWARTYLSMDETDIDDGTLVLFEAIEVDPDSVSEYGYTDPNIGKGSAARGRTFSRNSNWRR